MPPRPERADAATRRLPSHVIAFDDGQFAKGHRGDVLVVGVAYAGLRLDGVLATRVRRDGANATERLVAAVRGSRFAAHTRVILLQGIAFGGFNVIDIHGLHAALGMGVIVVMRRRPDLAAVRRALLLRVPGGARKWALVEAAGPVEPAGPLHVQRAGISLAAATALCSRLAVHGSLPEPLRAAHLIASGVTGPWARR